MGAQRSVLSYFLVPLIALVIGVAAAGLTAGVYMAFNVFVLAVLEISLSFDNAVVNAKILNGWDEKWRKRFMVWGMLIAVFGMRLVFPVLIVAAFGHMSPVAAVTLAFSDPQGYAHQLHDVHYMVAAFGGVFLAKVGLEHFLDADKESHWIAPVERFLSKLGVGVSVEVLVTLVTLMAIAFNLPVEKQLGFVTSGVAGLITFLVVKNLGTMATGGGDVAGKVIKAGIGGFIYLEVLDASFSFDGVIGAFAITTDLIWITVGLSIGALAVRELTLLAVDKGALAEFPHLEHGAFWAIIALAAIMLISPIVEVPETITGLIGAGLIGAAFVTSVLEKRKQAASGAPLAA